MLHVASFVARCVSSKDDLTRQEHSIKRNRLIREEYQNRKYIKEMWISASASFSCSNQQLVYEQQQLKSQASAENSMALSAITSAANISNIEASDIITNVWQHKPRPVMLCGWPETATDVIFADSLMANSRTKYKQEEIEQATNNCHWRWRRENKPYFRSRSIYVW